MNYDIISANTSGEFCQLVNHALIRGWDLHGYPFIENGRFYQAITKPCENPTS